MSLLWRGLANTNRARFIRYDNNNVYVHRVRRHCVLGRITNLIKKTSAILEWPSDELSATSLY